MTALARTREVVSRNLRGVENSYSCAIHTVVSAVKIIKSQYKSRGTTGDFAWMINQPEYANTLFVFNDNEKQFRAFLKGDPSGVMDGGGNAGIRSYQGHTPRRAAGIPTGDGGGYSELSEHVKSTIDLAVAEIKTLLDSGLYDQLVFSYNAEKNTLGTGIFNCAREVTDYIMNQILALGSAE